MNSTKYNLQKFRDLTEDWTQTACLAVSHSDHYTRMFFALVWGCKWIMFIHGWICPIRLIHPISWKSLHFEKKLYMPSVHKFYNWISPVNLVYHFYSQESDHKWDGVFKAVRMHLPVVGSAACCWGCVFVGKIVLFIKTPRTSALLEALPSLLMFHN